MSNNEAYGKRSSLRAVSNELKLRSMRLFRASEEVPSLVAAAVVGCAAAALAKGYVFLERGMIPDGFAGYLKAWERVCGGESPYFAAGQLTFTDSPGVLALAQFLPRDPERAWWVFGGGGLALLAGALLFCVRYRDMQSVGRLALGLVLSWRGCVETLDRGQPEILMMGIAVLAAASFESAPVFSGLFLGFLPGFKLAWFFLFLPFVLAARMDHRKRAHRFRRFLSGYLGGWLIWASALPSLTFGRDQSLKLSQQWVMALRSQPQWVFGSDANQSLWATAQRLGWPPLVAWGIAFLLAGLLLGKLIVRSQETASARIQRAQALVWISPWLLSMQLLSPLAWRWGSVLAVGMPAVWYRWGDRNSRVLRWTAATWIFFLWLLKQSWFLRPFGIELWTDLHAYGLISFYWLVLLVLA